MMCSPTARATSSRAPSERLGEVASALAAKLGDAAQVSIVFRPLTDGRADEEQAAMFMKLVSALDDEDDVQHVYSNLDIAGRNAGQADCRLSWAIWELSLKLNP